MRTLRFALLLVATLALLSACSTGTDTRVQAAVAETSMASATTGMMNTITDADSGAVARAINDGEIQLAQVALTNASAENVRDFAQMMITDHQNANAQLQTNGYGMMRNPITDVLNAEVNKTMTALRGKSGMDFDRAYIASQINMHQTALETMRTTLMPSAREENLRNVLTNMRSTVEMHLEHARSIQGTIGR
jgi:putative membrane protein